MEVTTQLEVARQNDHTTPEELSELEKLAHWRDGIRREAVAYYRNHCLQHHARVMRAVS